MTRCRYIAPLFALFLSSPALQAAPVGMGMVGDSLTDDYLGGPKQINNDLAAFSWGQILAAKRPGELDFGPYKPVGDLWDSSIRYSGYRNNWATSGGVASDNTKMYVTGFGTMSVAMSGTSYLSSQVQGIKQQIIAGELKTIYVGIGSNDFFYKTTYFDQGGNFYPVPNPVIDTTFINDVSSSILNAVDTLVAAGNNSGHPVQIVLGLIPPGTANGEATASVLNGIAAVNNILAAGAAVRGIPTVETFGWASDPMRVDSNGAAHIGHLVIERDTKATQADIGPSGAGPCDSTGCALPSHADHYLADDGLHPNTIIQAFIANQVIAALNTGYGYAIEPLHDSEILDVAGVPLPVACQQDADGDNIGAGEPYFRATTCDAGSKQITLISNTVRLGTVAEADNCPYASNVNQADTNNDGIGDACQGDKDSDGVADGSDNCPLLPNASQTDTDSDGSGNDCDNDDDGDTVADNKDMFPLDGSESADADNDGIGNNADPDDDNDTIADNTDNCPLQASADQTDHDSDGAGDVCDSDDDNDGVLDAIDLYPFNAAEAFDNDKDGIGDNADPDDDNDGYPDASDQLPYDANDHLDNDHDGVGDNTDNDDDNDGTNDNIEVVLRTNPMVANPYRATTTIESFENGKPAGWTTPYTATGGWGSSGLTASLGKKSLRSGFIGDSSLAQVETTLVVAGNSFSFDMRVSTEAGRDAARIYVDGAGVVSKSGELPWQTYTIDVTPGTHVVRWEYSKNASIAGGSDAVWIDKLTYVDGADSDSDGTVNALDAFPTNASETTDTDQDGTGDNSDNCPTTANANQLNTDLDTAGDACDSDDDNDGVPDSSDNCPWLQNATQADNENDGSGDTCDTDDDNDGVIDSNDAFPLDASESGDTDGDHIGNNSDPLPDNAALLNALNGTITKDKLGAAVAFVGDMDSDGYGDYAVGIPGYDIPATADTKIIKDAGRIEVISGRDSSVLLAINGSSAKELFGSALAANADINDDGELDIVVGAPGANRAIILFGPNGSNTQTINGTQAKSAFGAALALGDLNGDSTIEIAIGAPREDDLSTKRVDAGSVTIFNASGSALGKTTGTAAKDGYGSSIAIGDINNDNNADLVVGSPLADANGLKDAGTISGFSDETGTELFTQHGGTTGAGLGRSVAIGDIDADGTADIIGGAWKDDVLSPALIKDAGSVTVWHADGSSILSPLFGTAAKNYYGAALSAGDINGDGRDDLIIGIPGADSQSGGKTVRDSGRVEVLSGTGL